MDPNPFSEFDKLDAMFYSFAAKKKPEKGLPWRARTIDGEMYVPLAQVVELLAQNNVLPAVRRGLEKHLR